MEKVFFNLKKKFSCIGRVKNGEINCVQNVITLKGLNLENGGRKTFERASKKKIIKPIWTNLTMVELYRSTFIDHCPFNNPPETSTSKRVDMGYKLKVEAHFNLNKNWVQKSSTKVQFEIWTLNCKLLKTFFWTFYRYIKSVNFIWEHHSLTDSKLARFGFSTSVQECISASICSTHKSVYKCTFCDGWSFAIKESQNDCPNMNTHKRNSFIRATKHFITKKNERKKKKHKNFFIDELKMSQQKEKREKKVFFISQPLFVIKRENESDVFMLLA